MTDPSAEPRKSLKFRFRGAVVALKDFSPRATLLDWLREEASCPTCQIHTRIKNHKMH